MSPFGHAEFLLAAHDLKDLPPDSGTEIAFAGRSNSGKSSAINALTGRKRLAFSSKTPGRTQTINYYDLGERRYFVDLPGYGYAAVPAAERRHWALLISAYLQDRHALRGLVVIMDARRPFTELDCQLLDWFVPTGKPVHALLSKSDKLTTQQASASLRGAEASCARHPRCTVQLYSATAGTGVRAAQAILARWMK